MAQRAESAEKRAAIVDIKDVINVDELHLQAKKLKQARLPFKPLDFKALPPTPTSGSKKRKLLGPDSPSSKAKHHKQSLDQKLTSEKVKPIAVDNDNEVSSSSEAENLPSICKGGKSNILDKFIRRSSVSEEITSTNDVIEIIELQSNENSPLQTRSPMKLAKDFLVKSGAKEAAGETFARKLIFEKDKKSVADYNGEDRAADIITLESLSLVVDQDEISDTNKNISISVSPVKEPSEYAGEIYQNDVSVCDITAEDDASASSSAEERSGLGNDTSLSQKSDTDGLQSPCSSKQPISSSTPQTPDVNLVDGATLKSLKKLKPKSSTGKKISIRQKVKEDKERQKHEKKEKREKEKLAKRLKRIEEKAEKERAKKEERDKREKEKLQKKEQAEKEKFEKQQQKEEERKKKQEILDAKQEERKKKEEEKRLKEEEKQKEEEEKLKQEQKWKEAFQSFFIKPKTVSTTKVTKVTEGLFIPFELKKDMCLAPQQRRHFTDDDKNQFDSAMLSQGKSTNYLEQLKAGVVKPVRTGRILRKKKDVDEEVVLIIHDSEMVKKVTHVVKLLQFHTDYRPPYYGTWRKKVKGVSPRNPWKKDKNVFDYEVDSDEEWEEEEPGESLSDSNGEDEEADAEEEDDDGWMVPHGYLSEGEGCEDDEEVTPEMLKAQQRAKAQAWEVELKAKKHVAPPVHLGCYWQQTSASLSEKDLQLLSQFAMVCILPVPLKTLISNPRIVENGSDKAQDRVGSVTTSGKGFRKRAVPEEAIPDLIRLINGNSYGIKKLVREFRLYWKRKTAGPNDSINESHLEVEEPTNISAVDSSPLNHSLNESLVVIKNQSTEETCALKASSARNVENMETVEYPEKEIVNIKSVQEESGAGQDESMIIDDNSDHAISKRQLELKIIAIASREKRAGKSKQCWYVHENILKLYDLTTLPAENNWVYVTKVVTPKNTPHSLVKIGSKELETKTNKNSKKKKNVATDLQPLSDWTSETPPSKFAKQNKREFGTSKIKDQMSIVNFAKKTPAKIHCKEVDTKLSTEFSTSQKSKRDEGFLNSVCPLVSKLLKSENELKTDQKPLVALGRCPKDKKDGDAFVVDTITNMDVNSTPLMDYECIVID